MKSPRRDSVVPSEPRLLRLLEGPDRSVIRSSHGFGETLSADFRWGSFLNTTKSVRQAQRSY